MGTPHYGNDCDRYHDIVRDFGGFPPRPTITVLCGSTRFKDAWYEQGRRLTHEGHIVLSVGDLDTSSAARDVNVPIDPELKARLDELHKRKIDLADEVFVLNVGGYIGESTRSEIAYAAQLKKPVRYLEPDSAPIAGDTYNGFALDAYRDPGNTAHARCELRRNGELVREFTYPLYRVWTLLAHWRESDEVNPLVAAADAAEEEEQS